LEVQFDEHKLLVVYARKMKPFREIIRSFGLRRDDDMKFISEAEHLHGTEPHHREQFRDLAMRLGAGKLAAVGSDEG
jgi:hypothetical protein